MRQSSSGPRARSNTWRVALLAAVVASPMGASAQVETLAPPEPIDALESKGLLAAGLDAGAHVAFDPAHPHAPRAEARVEGTVAPGLRIVLKGGTSKGSDLNYRWIQTAGPPVKLDDPTKPDLAVVVPKQAALLEFLLVVSNAQGLDTARLSIPVDPNGVGTKLDDLVADAGDDQFGRVGQQITLNGIRSRPRGEIGYRWIQISGPEVALKLEDGYIFAFVPDRPGMYRFALVVARQGWISEPDTVQVNVVGSTAELERLNVASGQPTQAKPDSRPLDQIAGEALLAIEGGWNAAEPLAEAFDGVAERMDLYESYGEAFQEIARRLEPLLPSDPHQRSLWVDRLFEPLSLKLVEALRPSGLDLSRPDAQAAPLNPVQRQALAEQYRQIALGFGKVRIAR